MRYAVLHVVRSTQLVHSNNSHSLCQHLFLSFFKKSFETNLQIKVLLHSAKVMELNLSNSKVALTLSENRSTTASGSSRFECYPRREAGQGALLLAFGSGYPVSLRQLLPGRLRVQRTVS